MALNYKKAFDEAGAICIIEPQEQQIPNELSSKDQAKDKSSTTMICPKCQYEQPKSEICKRCGIVVEKYLLVQRKKRKNSENNKKKPLAKNY